MISPKKTDLVLKRHTLDIYIYIFLLYRDTVCPAELLLCLSKGKHKQATGLGAPSFTPSPAGEQGSEN